MARPKKNPEPQVEGISKRAAQFARHKTRFGDVGRFHPVEAVPREKIMPTVCTSLDILTGEGGYRPGSFVEWYGREGILKTRAALQQCRIAQLWAPDKPVAYFDTEYGVDWWAAVNEFNIDMGTFEDGTPKFWIFPNRSDEVPTMDKILDRIHLYAADDLFSLIVWDSVAATMSAWEAKQDSVTDAKVGGPAKDLSSACRRIKPVMSKSGAIILAVNQVRTVFVSTPMGQIAKLEPGGGFATRYAATHRFMASWKTKAKEDGEMEYLKVLSEKVKYGKGNRTTDLAVLDGKIDFCADLVICAERYGVIKKAGSWYSYQDSNIGQGVIGTANNLRNQNTLRSAIRNEVMAIACPETTEPYVPDNPDPDEEAL